MKRYQNRKKIILFIILLLLSMDLFPILNADDENRSEEVQLTVNHIDQTTIKISLNLPDFQFSTISYDENLYALIDCIDGGRSNVEGQANLPKIRKMIEIPQEATPLITINDVKWEETSLININMPSKIAPIQPAKIKTDENVDFVIDNEYYNQDIFTPNTIAEIIEINEIRGRRFALLEIAPVNYNPVRGDLRLMISCELTLELPNSNIDKTNEYIQRYSSSSFEEMFSKIFLNYGFYETNVKLSMDAEGYLIIVHDDFIEEITPFVNWKTSIGYNTTVTLTSEIPGGVTADNIKAYIKEAYDTWTIPPSYILIVGDTPPIPAFISDGGVTDTPYVTMDEDSFPDIYIGRFPAATETQVETMVEKTIYYEEGNFDSYDWIKKAVFMASVDNYEISEGTHNYVIETHLEPNDYVCDKLYQVTYGADTQDVQDSLNDGRSLAIYSGHGSTTSWGDGPPFSQSDVNGLTNDGMYPFVCSHACLTGKFSISECFGETWLRAPNKGAIAFWGSSINTQWDPDDIIERRVFDAWWDLDLERIGQMTDKGMYDAYMEYGSGMGKFIKSYNILGDASVKIWRDDYGSFNIYQDKFDRGFPIRHAMGGDWAAAQSFKPRSEELTGIDIYLRKFGTPEFDLVVELRENNTKGTLLDVQVFSPSQVPTSWEWFEVDFTDIPVSPETSYFIVIPPAPSGVSTSFGYEWGYAFGNQYDNGAFWFTRDGGSLWRDLPDMYEFTFRTY